MKAYRFDENTKEYLWEQMVQQDPKSGNYDVPQYCTFTEPPQVEEEQIQCYIDDEWQVFVDHRGLPQVNLETLEITKVDYIGSAHQGYQFISKAVADEFLADTDKYTVKNGVFVKRTQEEYEEIKKEKRQAQFNKEFFSTSLGYVRRTVSMQFTGEKKDFLSDLLPTISIGVSAGQTVRIITYTQPSFDEDVEDWTQYQNTVTVTPQFIQECFLQLQADFGVLNTEGGNNE